MIELFDVLCPNCERVITCLPTGGVAGCYCKRCKVDFTAKIVGRSQLYQFGRGYRRCTPFRVVLQEESLLPQAKERYEEEGAAVKPVVRDFARERLIPVPGLTIDASAD